MPEGRDLFPKGPDEENENEETKGIFHSHLPHADASECGAACSGNLTREAQTGMANGKRVPAIIKAGSEFSSPMSAAHFVDEVVHLGFLRLDAGDELQLGAAALEIMAGVVGLEINVSLEVVC